MPPVGSLASAFTFESIPVATLLVELDGRIAAANGAMARMAGVPGDSLVGRPVHDLVPELGGRWAALVGRARREAEVVDETPFDGPRGRRVLQLVLSVVDLAGEAVVQLLAIDMTARKAAEHAARARVEVDDQDAAGQRLESLGLVAGGIAHDFNNLLVGVLAEATTAREERTLADGTREALRRIEAAARRMAQLTRQLLAAAGRGPLVTTAVDPDEPLGDPRDQLAPSVLGGVRVLVADDEPSVRTTVRRLLERRGATVVVAADGLEAEARLRDEQFALVISDVSMPGRTGHDVLAVSRATQPGVPVILMSGYTERVRGEGGEAEPDAFLDKPFTANILDAAIDRLLKGG